MIMIMIVLCAVCCVLVVVVVGIYTTLYYTIPNLPPSHPDRVRGGKGEGTILYKNPPSLLYSYILYSSPPTGELAKDRFQLHCIALHCFALPCLACITLLACNSFVVLVPPPCS